MSGEAPMAQPIHGYDIVVFHKKPGLTRQILQTRLRLNPTGGAHISNSDDLIMQIEDAVFKNEEKVKSESED